MRKVYFCLMLLLTLCAILSAREYNRAGSATGKPFGRMTAPEKECKADSLTGFDVQKYEITLAINHQSHQINGNVLATIYAEENLTSLAYNLIGLTVSSVLVNGSAASYTHTNGIININLNILQGQTFTTQVFYSGVPQLTPDVYHIGMIFSGSTCFTISDPDAARYWWPCYDHPWDKAIVDLHITFRSDWKVAANGIRTGIVDNGDGTSTTHWIGSNPMTTYLVCITCAPYVEINQTAGSIPIQNFVTQNQYNNALSDLQNLPEMIDFYSSVFGPYPFEKYGNAVVSMSTYGAMEHQTMTTLGSYIINGNGTYETTIAHELAHMWYGDAVSFLTFKDVWLSEGFATYAEQLWVGHMEGWQDACEYIGANYHQYYINWEIANQPQVIYNPAFANYFAPPSYEKAASVLHMLRLKIGNDNFFQLLHDWFMANDNGNVVTAEFQALAEQISGQDLEQFFQQWIYSAGIPEVKYSVWTNNASDSPLKIIARTFSNTNTPFYVEVPFSIGHGPDSDSLLVLADPTGYTNYFSSTPQEGDPVFGNENHWTLLRGCQDMKPVLTECLPSNSAVMVSWEPFLSDPTLAYNVYRRTDGGPPQWMLQNQTPIMALSYTDLTAQNYVSYQYRICAVDQQGYISDHSNSMNATPVTFSFANDLLVVDETRDGNGSTINPNDTTVDTFYQTTLTPIVYQNWDCASQGIPPLDELGQYKLVLWHADDFSQNMLQDQLNTLGGYLLGGGRVLLSGWKTPVVMNPTFLQHFIGNVNLVYDNTASLISAQSTHYPELLVDPLKLLGPWNGMLPYIYTFTGDCNTIYTANANPSSPGNGNCIALRKTTPETNSDFVLFGFPLYFMQAEGVRNLLQELIPDMLDPSAADDPVVVPPALPTLKVAPNPFSSRTAISFTLPSKELATLSLYNIKGQRVRRISLNGKTSGELSLDALNDQGSPLSTGIYLLKLEQGGQTVIKKLSLLK